MIHNEHTAALLLSAIRGRSRQGCFSFEEFASEVTPHHLQTVASPHTSQFSQQDKFGQWSKLMRTSVENYALCCCNPSSRYLQMQRMLWRVGCNFFSFLCLDWSWVSTFGCGQLVLCYGPPCDFTSSEPVKMFQRRQGLSFRREAMHSPLEKSTAF